MTKILISPLNMKMIEDLKEYVDGYIVGLENYAINYPCFSLTKVFEIINYCKKINKEIFICLNKNIQIQELKKLEDILKKLDNINGILFYDNSILNLKEKYNLKHELVWASEHQVTNYQTINYYNKFGVNYALLSSDITLNEIFEIKNNTKVKLILPVLGYLPMFASKRNLVKNYLNKLEINDKNKINYMEKEGKIYPVIDNNLGTTVYSDSIYNIVNNIEQIKENKIDYILLNTYLIDNDFKEILKNINEQKYDKINDILKNTNTYFKDIETVYKVK